MTLSSWQLVVVGALAMVWAVVLGIPLLVDLLRSSRRRPPVSSSAARRRHRSLANRTAATRWRRPRPIRGFRSQEVVRKRLQILLACGMASTTAMFLAIAFRGLFVPLFAVMLACLLVIVMVGIVVGQAEHTNIESQHRARRSESRHGGDLQLTGLLGDLPLTEPDEVPTANPWGGPEGGYTIPTLADIADAFRTPDRSGFMFEPLNLDGETSDPAEHEVTAQALDEADGVEIPVDPALVAELGLDLPSESESGGPSGHAPGPRFQAAPEAGSRQASARARQHKRSRARPIQRDSASTEDGEKATRAIND